MNEEFDSALRALSDAAGGARRDLTCGENVDLTSLEALVEALTAASRNLAVGEAEASRNAILLLVAELDELRSLVQTEHAALRGRLEETGTRRTAAAAYGRPPSQSR